MAPGPRALRGAVLRRRRRRGCGRCCSPCCAPALPRPSCGAPWPTAAGTAPGSASGCGSRPGKPRRGLGKLLVVAPDQATARRYTALLQGSLGPSQAVALAISDERDAVERIARFRLRPEPAVLVTVGMAYEGMDAPEISHVACLTQIRSVPWLEQMVARATRFDPHGGDYERQRAVIYHPDDPLFRRFRRAIEADQSGRARVRRQPEQAELPLEDEADLPPGRPLLQPLRSDATDLRFETVLPRRRCRLGRRSAGGRGWPAGDAEPGRATAAAAGRAAGGGTGDRGPGGRAWSTGRSATTPTTRCSSACSPSQGPR